jgi:hypothetical protein
MGFSLPLDTRVRDLRLMAEQMEQGQLPAEVVIGHDSTAWYQCLNSHHWTSTIMGSK